MSTKIKIRRDTQENWNMYNPVLGDGELALIKDTGEIKVGNGSSRVMEIPSINNSFNGYAYEKIKEVNNIRDLANLSISCIDTDEIVIELFVKTQLNIGVSFAFNNDFTGGNYLNQQGSFDSNNNCTSGENNTVVFLSQTNFGTNQIALAKVFPKEKQIKTELWNYNTDAGVWREYFRYYYWLNDTDSVQTLNFNNVSNEDVPCTCRIYKRVQIVAQAPYKKLVASASNVKDINGITINIDQNKKYKIELIGDLTNITDGIKMYANNDNSQIYSGSYIGIYTDHNLHSGNSANNSIYILINPTSMKGRTIINILLEPTIQTFVRKQYVVVNNLPCDYRNVLSYNGGQINTLNFTSPNDDISCKFKVWEITE